MSLWRIQRYIVKNSVKLQYLNWQLGLQLKYRKIIISYIINIELQTVVFLCHHFIAIRIQQNVIIHFSVDYNYMIILTVSFNGSLTGVLVASLNTVILRYF